MVSRQPVSSGARMLVVSTLAFMLGWWTARSGPESPVVLDEGAPGRGKIATAVRVLPVTVQDASSFLQVAGEVQSRSELEIDARIAARVVAVHAKAQDRVAAGDLLVTLDDADLREQKRQAESSLAQGRAVLEEARSQLARIESLFERRVETQQAVERSRRDLRAAAAEVDRLGQAVAEATIRLDFARIVSPIAGIVVDRRVEPGELAMPGKTLLEIHDPAALRFQALVPESCHDKAQPGATIRLSLSGVPGTVVTSITELVPRVDPSSRMFPVRVDLPGDLALRPGTFGTMALPCRPTRILAVPRGAIVARGQLDMLHVVRGGHVNLRLVTLGRSMPEYVEVLTGLTEGEEIVLDPPPTLRDGDPVTVAPATERRTAGGAR